MGPRSYIFKNLQVENKEKNTTHLKKKKFLGMLIQQPWFENHHFTF